MWSNQSAKPDTIKTKIGQIMKNTKSKFNALAAAAENIAMTCTPAVAAVKPMRGELAQETYTPEQVLNNLKIIREDLRDFPMSLDGGPGYARYIADSIIERGITF